MSKVRPYCGGMRAREQGGPRSGRPPPQGGSRGVRERGGHRARGRPVLSGSRLHVPPHRASLLAR
ncbi:MAG: hypothetical protein E6K18_00635 [Methanobacteriota archaeon]|nr:MAG: hypothetical protein E6K18_00635 [Euryarchaeota archaeon]